MFRLLQNAFLSMVLVTTSVVPSYATAMTGADGQYFFRYKTSLAEPYTPPENPDPETKDITAFYVGGVGFEFSERLPMKPQWADDSWRIVKGSLPDGLNFDPDTLTFSGTPSGEVAAKVVQLAGYDTLGNEVATAVATFDVVMIKGAPVKVDIYNHTGKYKVDEMAIPSNISVYKWNNLKSAPAGVSINGPYIEGTPTTAARTTILGQGLNYAGEIVVTYIGSYVTEDGPTFPKIADMILPLPQMEYGFGLNIGFGAPSRFKINQAIDPTREPRYFIELDNGEEYPIGVSSNDDVKNLLISGMIRQPYDTARVRFKAIDSDQTPGVSNWFIFGSGDPQPSCQANIDASTPINLFTGRQNSFYVPKPMGGQGVITYNLSSGKLPNGLRLDSATGLVSGNPTTVGDDQDLKVRIDVTNGSNTVSTECGYRIVIGSEGVKLVDATDRQARHVRVNTAYNGTVDVVGGISPYSVALTTPSDWPTLSFTTPTADTANVGLTGVFATGGVRSVPLTLSNGDGQPTPGAANLTVHPALSIGTVPTVHVKRYAASQAWAFIPYDQASVIPDVANQGKYPTFSVKTGTLPEGIKLSGDALEGSTSAEAKTYGPFSIEIADYSGDRKPSNQFNVVVDPRDEIAAKDPVPPTFTVDWDREQSPDARVVDVVQPEGAKSLSVIWTLNGSAPSWLTFDTATGDMKAAAGIPQSELGNHGPFTITATDSEGSSITSKPFDITVRDWPLPAGYVTTAFHGTAQGDASHNENAPKITISDLFKYVDVKNTIIGGASAVTLVSADPLPAGLAFDPVTGALSGTVTEEFNGNVRIVIKDGRDRLGFMDVPLEVRGYPRVTTPAATYDLPRLSDAVNASPAIQGKQVSGFWTTPVWAWADGVTPPDGVSVNAATGQITGVSSATANTVYSNLKLKATSKAGTGETIVSETALFSIKVVAPVPLTLAYNPAKATFRLKDLGNGRYSLVSVDNVAPTVGGSAVAPLTFSIDQAQANSDGLNGIGINTSTGSLTGSPDTLGSWTVKLNVADKEGSPPSGGAVDVTVKSTLSGNIETTAGNKAVTLRQGEPFAFPAIPVTNVVGTARFLTSPADLPTVDFSSLTGAFSDESHIDSPADLFSVAVSAKDDDDRMLSTALRYDFTIVKPLEIVSFPAAQTSIASKQYSANAGDPIDVTFTPNLKYAMGKVTWVIEGTLPGTAVAARYDDDDKVLLGYGWTDASSSFHELSVDSEGKVTGYKVDNALTATPSEAVSYYLPPDALVFDPVSLTLKGIPSKAGTFDGIHLVAYDDHKDAYIKSVPTRTTYNKAASPEITISVAAADPLVATNMVGTAQASTETLYRYTSQPTLRTELANAAYGRGATWTKVSGTLPQSVTAAGTVSLTYSGYPETTGVFSDIVYRATDAAGRKVTADAVTLNVAARQALALASTANPAGLLVNAVATPIVVAARNTPYGEAIKDADWTLTGVENLPPGMSAKIKDGKVSFEGTPTVIGNYQNIVVAARDSLGGTASITLTMTVILPTDAIVLNVSNIKTKVGYDFEMQATASNTYGTVRFYSNDIAGIQANQMEIDGATGLVTGKFTTTGDRTVDVYVTDTTNRVTSKPVQVAVLPDLRVAVPEIVAATQATALTRSVATDYVIGTVTYKKGAGNWPDGFVVDPGTGTITAVDTSSGTAVNNVVAEAKDYPGLTITATDAFGNGLKDTEESNVFTVRVNPTTATPVITGITNNRMVFGTEGTAAIAFTPTVKDSAKGNPWKYAGTSYSLNRTLPAGLSFDTTTGTISGTPSEAAIIRDLKIKVTSQSGDSSETPAFWFGVAPKDAIVATAGQNTLIGNRQHTPLVVATAPSFDNVIGNLTFSKLSGNIAFGVDAATGKVTDQNNWWSIFGLGDYPVDIKVTDEFERTGQITVTVKVIEGMTISQTASIVFDKATTYAAALAPTVTGIGGTKSFVVTGLPDGVTYDTATGAVSGKIDDRYTDANTFNITWTVTDSIDGTTASVTREAVVNASTGKIYWRYLDRTTVGLNSGGTYISDGIQFTDFTTADGSVPVKVLGSVSGLWNSTTFLWADKVWAVSGTAADGLHHTRDAEGYWREFKFTKPASVISVQLTYTNTWTLANTSLAAPIVQSSEDGITWNDELTRLTGAGQVVQTIKK